MRSAENLAERCKRLRYDAVVGPAAAAISLDEARVAKDFEVMTDRWLAEPKRLRQMADARLTVRLRLDQAQQLEARGVGEDPQRRCEVLCGLLIDRARRQRRTGRGDRGDGFHERIFTEIDIDSDR